MPAGAGATSVNVSMTARRLTLPTTTMTPRSAIRCSRLFSPDARKASSRVVPTSSDARADSQRPEPLTRGPMSISERITIEPAVTAKRRPKRSSSLDLSSKIGLRLGFLTRAHPSRVCDPPA